MLYLYQRKNIVKVRSEFGNDQNALYTIIEIVCLPYLRQAKTFMLSSEQVFAETIIILDGIKEHQENYKVGMLWDRLENDYAIIGTGAPEEEIKAGVSIVLTTVFAALMGCPNVLHQRYARRIIAQVHAHGQSETANKLAMAYDKHLKALTAWVEEYIDSDEFLSERLPNGDHEADEELVDTSIPEDCRQAAQRIFTQTYKNNKQAVIVSSSRFVQVAATITRSKPATLACLLAIAQEVGCVKRDINSYEFVRALIGLKLLPYKDLQDINNKANGIDHKLNGQRSKGIDPLPSDHTKWSSRDQATGKGLYDEFMK